MSYQTDTLYQDFKADTIEEVEKLKALMRDDLWEEVPLRLEAISWRVQRVLPHGDEPEADADAAVAPIPGRAFVCDACLVRFGPLAKSYHPIVLTHEGPMNVTLCDNCNATVPPDFSVANLDKDAAIRAIRRAAVPRHTAREGDDVFRCDTCLRLWRGGPVLQTYHRADGTEERFTLCTMCGDAVRTAVIDAPTWLDRETLLARMRSTLPEGMVAVSDDFLRGEIVVPDEQERHGS